MEKSFQKGAETLALEKKDCYNEFAASLKRKIE